MMYGPTDGWTDTPSYRVVTKNKLTYDPKEREALKIRPGHGPNEDYGAYVKTTM